jgi:hypothetical protein
MEFPSRKDCIEHYQGLYPNIPKFMIDVALEYDLSTQKQDKKPQTGKARREVKRNKDKLGQEAKTSKRGPAQWDSTAFRVVKPEDYTACPMMKGCINVDGCEVVNESAAK